MLNCEQLTGPAHILVLRAPAIKGDIYVAPAPDPARLIAQLSTLLISDQLPPWLPASKLVRILQYY
jgi:hypothetical protein